MLLAPHKTDSAVQTMVVESRMIFKDRDRFGAMWPNEDRGYQSYRIHSHMHSGGEAIQTNCLDRFLADSSR